MIYYILDGGFLMWPILLCSVIAFTFLIDRLIYVIWFNIRKEKNFLTDLEKIIQTGDLDKALSFLQKSKDPFSPHYKQLILNKDKDLMEVIDQEIQKKQYQIDRRHTILETIVKISPLFGILGTVVGIILTFEALNDAALADMSDKLQGVTSGIGQALNTTAAGLSVSLITLIGLACYNSFANSFYKNFIAGLDHLAIEIVGLKKKREFES